jgi:hypothetical protein
VREKPQRRTVHTGTVVILVLTLLFSIYGQTIVGRAEQTGFDWVDAQTICSSLYLLRAISASLFKVPNHARFYRPMRASSSGRRQHMNPVVE